MGKHKTLDNNLRNWEGARKNENFRFLQLPCPALTHSLTICSSPTNILRCFWGLTYQLFSPGWSRCCSQILAQDYAEKVGNEQCTAATDARRSTCASVSASDNFPASDSEALERGHRGPPRWNLRSPPRKLERRSRGISFGILSLLFTSSPLITSTTD